MIATVWYIWRLVCSCSSRCSSSPTPVCSSTAVTVLHVYTHTTYLRALVATIVAQNEVLAHSAEYDAIPNCNQV